MIFARKIIKIPEFLMMFARKMSEFSTTIARKKYFPRFFWRGMGGGHVFPLPHPVSYAYGSENFRW